MIRYFLFFTISLVFMLSGCTSTDIFQTGQSSITDVEWDSKIHLNETTEKEVVDLLGKPYGYYHKFGEDGKVKYLLYTHYSTEFKSFHLPFIAKAQVASAQKASVKRVWFYVNDDIVTEILQAGKKPDLKNFLLSTDSEYPYGKCKIKRSEGNAS